MGGGVFAVPVAGLDQSVPTLLDIERVQKDLVRHRRRVVQARPELELAPVVEDAQNRQALDPRLLFPALALDLGPAPGVVLLPAPGALCPRNTDSEAHESPPPVSMP
jgi:hypothetical protein